MLHHVSIPELLNISTLQIMVKVTKTGIILQKTALDFENEGVLNPAVWQDGDTVHLFYRAVSKGNHSTIGYCELKGPITIVKRSKTPLLTPEFDYESHGVEDPRIVKIEGQYYLTYTAYDSINALGALATSEDLRHFTKKGLIVPRITYEEFSHLAAMNGSIDEKYLHFNGHVPKKQGKKILMWDKDVVFFPRKINNRFVFLHRIRPDIQLVSVDRLQELTPEFWEEYFTHLNDHIVLAPICDHEVCYIGAGCPPIETAYGWLLIYHGVHESENGNVYSACAALLDLENPQKEIARLPYPLFVPEETWEVTGEVNNVCFPTGTTLFGETLHIYYGAADEQIACASVSLKMLLEELLNNTKK